MSDDTTVSTFNNAEMPDLIWLFLFLFVEGQEDGPIESRYFSGFFILSVQVLVLGLGQELIPIAEKDKNMSRLPIR
jgi:hypothetical protein